jgi:hypothetical protein
MQEIKTKTKRRSSDLIKKLISFIEEASKLSKNKHIINIFFNINMITENNYQSFCSISSPAKAILCGEHAVVYAKDAIAIGISLHCRANIQKRNKI